MSTTTRLITLTVVLLLSAAANAGHSEVSMINSARARRGVHALQLDRALDAVARARASRMAASGYKGHLSGSYSPGRAEGVAWSTNNPSGIVRACYITSRNFKFVGAACVKGRNGYFFSVIYR